MSNIILTDDTISGIVNSADTFPIDFDDAWVWAGYSRKDNAKRKLTNGSLGLKEDRDFLINEEKTTGRALEKIWLTVDAFEHFCLASATDQGYKVRQHFIECRRNLKKAVETIAAQQDDIWHWKARAMEAEERLIAKKEAVSNMYPAHIAGMILGASVEVPVVEKPTIEVIDDRHNTRFSGQTLAQINDYLKTRYGIKKFKSGADLKRYLERTGKADLIAQTLRSISSDYVPEENLEALYEAILQGDRQTLLGEP
jgi:phage anti-repressor protein